MGKRKTRAGRKVQRERAARAERRGLPQAPVEQPKVVAAGVGKSASSRRASETTKQSSPVFFKVLIGAAVALALVYALSQMRKGDVSSASGRANPSPSNSPN